MKKPALWRVCLSDLARPSTGTGKVGCHQSEQDAKSGRDVTIAGPSVTRFGLRLRQAPETQNDGSTSPASPYHRDTF